MGVWDGKEKEERQKSVIEIDKSGPSWQIIDKADRRSDNEEREGNFKMEKRECTWWQSKEKEAWMSGRKTQKTFHFYLNILSIFCKNLNLDVSANITFITPNWQALLRGETDQPR